MHLFLKKFRTSFLEFFFEKKFFKRTQEVFYECKTTNLGVNFCPFKHKINNMLEKLI